MTSHIVFNMIIYITQVGGIKGEQEAYASQSPIWVVTHRQKKNGSKMMRRCRSFLIMCSGGSRGGGGVTGVITPPLVAEIFLCSNSNFSPTGAITPP